MAAFLLTVLLVAACEERASETQPPPAGANGVSCWDTNANGVCDVATEDVDASGGCDVIDCQGPPGEPGVDGINGTDGLPGSSCWDNDVDGECDAAEDRNGDTVCDALDCIGTMGTLDGLVQNAASANPLAGVLITMVPEQAGFPFTTVDDGIFGATLPTGFYTLTFTKDDFATVERTVPIAAARTTAILVELEPDAPVVVNAGADTTATPGGDLTLTPTITISDDSGPAMVDWEQPTGLQADRVTVNPDGSLDIRFQSASAYKADLLPRLVLQDRTQVVPINFDAYQLTSSASFEITVTTSSGVYVDTVAVQLVLPWPVSPGLRNLPTHAGVLLQGKGLDADPWSWTVLDPGGAAVTVVDANTRFPYFEPLVAGVYTAAEANSGATIVISAGTWAGSIDGRDAEGNPTSTTLCDTCHADAGQVSHPEIFPAWAQSGHATVFSDTLNEAGVYHQERCFACHAVGYMPQSDASNNGLDDQSDFDDFLASGMLGNPDPSNWTNMLAQFPMTARLTNVGCDSCHGPNGSEAHQSDPGYEGQRISLASEVCATCHSEVDRRGRFQQWQSSAHASYVQTLECATVENGGTNLGRCGRCHSAQGFLHWYRQADLTADLQGAAGNATNDEMAAWGMTVAQVEPQTCATCHDPHAAGSISGDPNDANVRVVGNTTTLPGGFAATAMGRGAVCAMCHNSTGGKHDDTVALTSYRMPHQSCQSDVLLGQNAYFVEPGLYRSPHAYIEDTCTGCHMQKTPPPEDLAFEGEGTNHTFLPNGEACAACHGDLSLEWVMAVGEVLLEEFHGALTEAAVARLNAASVNGGVWIKAVDPVSGGASSSSSTFPAASTILIDTLVNPVVSVELIELQDQGALKLTLTSNLVWFTSSGLRVDSNVVWVQFRALWDFAKTSVVYQLAGNYVRGVFNYLLLRADKSKAVHNPGFYNQVVHSTLAQDLSF